MENTKKYEIERIGSLYDIGREGYGFRIMEITKDEDGGEGMEEVSEQWLIKPYTAGDNDLIDMIDWGNPGKLKAKLKKFNNKEELIHEIIDEDRDAYIDIAKHNFEFENYEIGEALTSEQRKEITEMVIDAAEEEYDYCINLDDEDTIATLVELLENQLEEEKNN